MARLPSKKVAEEAIRSVWGPKPEPKPAKVPATQAKCPITKEKFLEAAKMLAVTINGEQRVAARKEFSTGSFGWHMNDKITITVDGIPLKVQANLSLVVVGSKNGGSSAGAG